MLVLGVDPGLTRCGLGLVEGAAGRPLVLRHVEVISTPSTQPLADRLLLLSSRIRDLVSDQPPDVVAVERMFSQHNLHTVMGTAQASAAAVLAAAEAGIPVVWHTPSEVKAAVTGSGRADKAQVASMVVRILGLAAAPRPVDATDALALAICHVWRGSAASRIDLAVSGAPPSRIPRRSPGRAATTRPPTTAQRRGSRPAATAVPLPGARIRAPRSAP